MTTNGCVLMDRTVYVHDLSLFNMKGKHKAVYLELTCDVGCFPPFLSYCTLLMFSKFGSLLLRFQSTILWNWMKMNLSLNGLFLIQQQFFVSTSSTGHLLNELEV